MNMIAIAALVLILGYVFYVFSKISRIAKSYRQQKTEMDEVLEKRYKIYKNLVKTFESGMDIEKSNLREIEILREKSLAAKKENDEKTRIGMEDKMSHIAGGVSFIFEQHPSLKESPKAHEVHDELVKIEEELAQYKEKINQLIDEYHKATSGLFPWMINKLFAKHLHVNPEPWHINSDALGEKEKYTVQM